MSKDPKQNYKLLSVLGSGTYAKVHKAIRLRDQTEVAVKVVNILRINAKSLDSGLNEIRILGSLANPYIVHYYESFVESNQSELWIVMELLEGGDLLMLIDKLASEKKRMDEKLAWRYLINILCALDAMHALGAIHRDLKPGNIFLTSDHQTAKLGDMNVSKIVGAKLANTMIGSPGYVAPEIWKHEPYDKTCDTFSLGCSIFELLAQTLPFDGENIVELKQAIINKKAPRLPQCYSEDLQNIISKCLTKAPSQRPSASKLLKDPIIVKKIAELGIEIIQTIDRSVLLDPITMPENKIMLNGKLPKGSPMVKPVPSGPPKTINQLMVEKMYFSTIVSKTKPKTESSLTPRLSKPQPRAPLNVSKSASKPIGKASPVASKTRVTKDISTQESDHFLKFSSVEIPVKGSVKHHFLGSKDRLPEMPLIPLKPSKPDDRGSQNFYSKQAIIDRTPNVESKKLTKGGPLINAPKGVSASSRAKVLPTSKAKSKSPVRSVL